MAGARTTIRDVAKDADVSVATVSKVLRDVYGVSEALRERVERSIEKLNYRPRTSARGMRGRTYTLGIVLSDIANPFFSDILSGIHATLEKTPYKSVIGTSMNQEAVEKNMIEAMIDRQMDGLILVSPHVGETYLQQIAGELPTLTLGYHRPEATEFDTVNTDDIRGGRIAVRHLIEAGNSDIAMLSSAIVPEQRPRELTVTHQRELGYLEAMNEAGLGDRARILRASHGSSDIDRVVRALLSGADRPQALFCWADFYAFMVMSIARECGLDVPGDLAVVGFDDTMHCRLAQNDLTSVNQAGARLGELAAGAVIERIEGRKEARHVVLPPSLSVRRSSQPASPRAARVSPPKDDADEPHTLSSRLKGVACLLVAPFDADDRLDVPLLKPVVDRAVAAGVNVLVANGDARDRHALTLDEAVEHTLRLPDLVDGRIPLLAGVGRSVGEACHMARTAASAGADGVIIDQPPGSVAASRGLVEYVKRIRDAAAGLPIVISVCDDAVGVECIGDLCRIENVVGLHWAAPNPMTLALARSAAPDGTVVLSGRAEGWAPAFYAVGASGIGSVLANVWPERSVAIHRALEKGNLEEARALISGLREFETIRQEEGSGAAVVRAALKLQGMDLGAARPPAAWPLTAASNTRLEAFLRSNRLLGM